MQTFADSLPLASNFAKFLIQSLEYFFLTVAGQNKYHFSFEQIKRFQQECVRQAAGIPLSKFSPHVQLTTEPGKF